MDERGIPYDKEAIDLVFQCCLCSACTNNCATGYDPTVFTREARSVAIARDILPAWLSKIVDAALEGTLKFVDEPICDQYRTIVDTLDQKAEVLLYRGGYTDGAVPLMRVLSKAGVNFTVLKDELPSGAHLGDLVGYVDEVKEVAVKWMKQLDDTGCDTVVVLNPTDAAFIKQQMVQWEIVPKAKIVTATAYVAHLIEKKQLKVQSKKQTVTFHDPSRLARILDDTVTPRTLIHAANAELTEMFLHGKLANSSGSALMQLLYPSIVDLMVASRWVEIERTGAHTVVTASPENYHLLKSGQREGFEVLDVFSLLLD
jgi:Fe-S oxidoreductase